MADGGATSRAAALEQQKAQRQAERAATLEQQKAQRQAERAATLEQQKAQRQAERQRQAAEAAAAEAERQRQAAAAAEAERQRQAAAAAEAERQRQAAVAAEAERQRQAAEAAAAEAERQRQAAEAAAAARYAAQQKAQPTAPTFTSTSGYATKSTPIGRVAQRAEGGEIKGYSGKNGSAVSAKESQASEMRLRRALNSAPKVNYEENDTNVPDWVLEESAKSLKGARSEAAKKRQEAKAKGDEWGKEQVDRQKRREEILAGRPRSDADRARSKSIDSDWGSESRDKLAQRLIPDAPAPFSEGNPEDKLKFNPGSEDEMTASEARSKADGYKKGGDVKKSKGKNWIKDAIKKPGSLRKSLKVKEGEKIPAKKLAAAAKKPGKTGQRARLAQTLKKFSKGGGIESRGKTRCKIC
jgi:hypothetical protein